MCYNCNMDRLRIYTDGGARGNPGPAGIGAALYQVHEDGVETLVAEVSEYIGETTNNQAEYRALIAALKKASGLKPEKLEVRMDSELVIKQLRGEYRVRNAELAPLFAQIQALKLLFPQISFAHVRREKNHVADALVNLAIDRHLKKK